MEWIKTNVSLPKPIIDLYNHIRLKSKNVCIAGGMLSDLYMDKPFKDVDFFLNSMNVMTIEYHMVSFGAIASQIHENRNFANTYDIEFTFDVRNYRYEGYEVQLIFTAHGAKIAKFFDFRFREFIYVRGNVFASREALSDIRDCKLTIGSFHSPLRTLARMYRFMSKYTFTPDENSFDLFKSTFNSYQISEVQVNVFLSRMSTGVPEYESLKELLVPNNQNIVILPSSYTKGVSPSMDWLISYLCKAVGERDLIEATCHQMKNGIEVTRTHIFDWCYFDEVAYLHCHRFRDCIRKARLSLLYQIDALDVDVLLKRCDELLDTNTRKDAIAQILKFERQLSPMFPFATFHPLSSLYYGSRFFGKQLQVKISNLPNFIRMPHSLRLYTQKNPISLSFSSLPKQDSLSASEDEFFAGFVYDPARDAFIKNAISHSEIFSPLLSMFHEAVKNLIFDVSLQPSA